MHWLITFKRQRDGQEVIVEADSPEGASRDEIDAIFTAAKQQLSMPSDWRFVKASGR